MSVIFVTGGSSGIGLATVRRLAASGHRVFYGSRTAAAEPAGDSVHVPLDLADPASCAAAAIAELIQSDAPPARLVVGADGAEIEELVRRSSAEDLARLLRESFATLMALRW